MEALLKPADQLLIIDYRRIENPGQSNIAECLNQRSKGLEELEEQSATDHSCTA
jgi:hypothetical protein